MRKLDLGKSGLEGSVISLGCMRISSLSDQEVDELLAAAWDSGIDFYDHADIYGGGRSEEVFAGALSRTSIRREEILIQSKCGIRKGMFDFSRDHILAAVEGSLRRLQTDYLDVLLLHRPDTLVEQPLIANQLQLSLTNTGMIDAGFNVNMEIDPSIVRDGGILEYCRLHDITIQPWSPFQYGFFEGVFLGNDKFPELNRAIDAMAADKGVTNSAIAVAWLLRHPAKMQPILGTTQPQRVREIARAAQVEMTREEWYRLYLAAGNRLP
jgi:predicted oxidoreductase